MFILRKVFFNILIIKIEDIYLNQELLYKWKKLKIKETMVQKQSY